MASGFEPYLAVLRGLGFQKKFDERSKINGRFIMLWKRVSNRRVLTVQLFGGAGDNLYRFSDGRVSSCFALLKPEEPARFLGGCSDTCPAEFNTPDGLIRAVITETVRTDGKYAQPGSLYSGDVAEEVFIG